MLVGGKSLAKTFLLRKRAEGLPSEARRKAARETNAETKEEAAPDTDVHGLSVEAADEAAQLVASAQGTRAAADLIRPRRVAVYNARHDGADLVGGLTEAFRKDLPFFMRYRSVLVDVARTGGVLVKGRGIPGADSAFKGAGDVVAETLQHTQRLKNVIEAFIRTCEAEGTFPCLIVDEAHVAFAAGEGNTGVQAEQDRARTLAALRLLTEYTKEGRRMNVIFSSSEYSEPYRLSELGFKSDHFTRTVLMPETAPKDMRALLKEKWGMGEELATACMSVWGGHIWATPNGISCLTTAKDAFATIENPITFSADALDGVVASLEGRPVSRHGAGTPPPPLESSEKAGLIVFLRQLAIEGCVPLPSRGDPRAKLLGWNNVGGIITRNTVAPGLTSDARRQARSLFFAVPASQATRVLLADCLQPGPAQ